MMDRLLKADDVSLVTKAERDGKIRLSPKCLDEAVGVKADQVLELRPTAWCCLAG